MILGDNDSAFCFHQFHLRIELAVFCQNTIWGENCKALAGCKPSPWKIQCNISISTVSAPFLVNRCLL
jgi:hypothetical protein